MTEEQLKDHIEAGIHCEEAGPDRADVMKRMCNLITDSVNQFITDNMEEIKALKVSTPQMTLSCVMLVLVAMHDQCTKDDIAPAMKREILCGMVKAACDAYIPDKVEDAK